MACDATLPHLSMYIDAELDADLEPSMFAHLSACSRCREFLRASLALRDVLTMESTDALTRDGMAMPDETPPSFLAVPVRSVRDAPTRRSRHPIGRRLTVGVTTLIVTCVAVGAVALGLLAFLLKDKGTPEQEVVYVTTLPTVEVAPVATSSQARRHQ